MVDEFDDLLFPDRCHAKQLKESTNKKSIHFRTFKVNELVYVKNFHQGEKWLPGKVVAVIGTVMYKVMLENCQKIVRRHVNQLRKRSTLNTDMDIGQTEVETMVPALSNTESTNAELQNSAFEPEQENSTEPRYPTRNSLWTTLKRGKTVM